MSLFTNLAFSVALFLAFVERQLRDNRQVGRSPDPAASSTA